MPCLSVFSTNGSGFADWAQVGTLVREVALYKKFAANGWDVNFYTYDRCRQPPSPGFPATTYPQWPYLLPRRLDVVYQAILPLLRLASGRRSTVVMTNQAHSGWPTVIAGRLWGAKVVARCGMVHGECSEVLNKTGKRARKKAKAEKWTFQHADKCIVPTKLLAKWISEHYGIEAGKIAVIPNYVDTGQFTPQPDKDKQFDIICVGRLVDKKRHHLLLESIAGCGLKVHIIGAGKLRDQLAEFARKHDIDLKITDRVNHSCLPEMFNASRMYVNVAQWEGHPKALIEAMSCGCPCIGARSPGIENTLIDGQTGLLVDPEPLQIRQAVLRLMQQKDLAELLSRRAREAAVEDCSLERIFGLYKQVFDELQAT